MTKISFIYFDVGGVLVFDFIGTNKRVIMRRDIGVPPDRAEEFDKYYDDLEVLSTRGIDLDSYKPEIIAKFALSLPGDFSFHKYLADRLEPNPSLWPVVGMARANFRIGLLTDMYPGLLQDIRERHLLPEVEWDVVVDSSAEGSQKPDIQLYEIAERKVLVPPAEILFIDNLQSNLEPAIARGWQTFHYDPLQFLDSNKRLKKFLRSNL